METTLTEAQKKAAIAVCEFLQNECSYTDLLEEAADAQQQLLVIADHLEKTPEHSRPMYDHVHQFMYYALRAIKTLKGFEDNV